MLTPLRAEARAALDRMAVRRKPALRRSEDPGALLATDLPLAADAAAVEAFTKEMEARGWQVWRAANWLLLDKAVPAPPMEAVPGACPGELGCCISLLARHSEGAADAADIRALVKAAESGSPALERLCGQLHAEWAAALREHRSLPGGLLPYLCRAAEQMKQGGNVV